MTKELGPDSPIVMLDHVMTVGAVTTAPTKGTVVTDVCKYWRFKQFLFMRWDYLQSAGGTAGSGVYLFPIPAGLTIDVAKYGLNSAERTMGVCGPARSEAGTVYWVGTLHVYDETRLQASGTHDTADGTFNATNTPLSTTDRSYSLFAQWIPIVEWS